MNIAEKRLNYMPVLNSSGFSLSTVCFDPGIRNWRLKPQLPKRNLPSQVVSGVDWLSANLDYAIMNNPRKVRLRGLCAYSRGFNRQKLGNAEKVSFNTVRLRNLDRKMSACNGGHSLPF